MNYVHNAYRQSRNTSLTRIDVLIKLYNKAINTLENAKQAFANPDTSAADREKLMASRCLVALLDGINREQDEVSENTYQICLYAINQVWEGGEANFENAVRVLTPIRNAFVAVRDEAVELELSGKIPPLNLEPN